VAVGTIGGELAAVEEFLASAGVWAWEVEARHADRFLGHDQHGRAHATRRGKAGAIDFFYRFLELRYRGELHELTGRLIGSPIDEVNRPRQPATSPSGCRPRRRRWLRSLPAGGVSWPAPASG
jgi:hypothetical protein